MTRDDMAAPEGLSDRLWAATSTLHREAERSGLLQDLLRGRAGRSDYALLLRGLLPVYEALEAGLKRLPISAPVQAIARPELYRASALRSDLAALGEERGPELRSAGRYAERIAEAGEGGGELLLAHAYVRYLGDLNGGQILRRLLARSLELDAGQLAFYAFPAIADPQAFAGEYRAIIDRVGMAPPTVERVIAEAQAAFRLNIELSEEAQRLARGGIGTVAASTL